MGVDDFWPVLSSNNNRAKRKRKGVTGGVAFRSSFHPLYCVRLFLDTLLTSVSVVSTLCSVRTHVCHNTASYQNPPPTFTFLPHFRGA